MTQGEKEPYRNLANAIIVLAAKDYRYFRRYASNHQSDHWSRSKMKELEKFFLSSWCDFLAGELDGSYILERLKKEEDG